MTDRERLIEILDERQKHGVRQRYIERIGCEMEEDVPNSYLADHLIANGVTVQRWIPVTERLPEKLCKYNVMIRGEKKPTVLWYYPNKKTWEDELFGTPYPVTHWMPMPEPPKEGE